MNTAKKDKKVMIIFYSLYGHIEKLAHEIFKGVNSIEGVKGELWRIPETLSDEVLTIMKAPKKSEDIPLLTFDKLDLMKEADGFLFGIPTRYGLMSGQCKTFWDQTGKYWVSNAFAGKPAGIFFSTGTQGGGQETTALTTLTHFSHMGIVFVPIGNTFGQDAFTMSEIKGGSAYGAGTYAGPDGSRQVSDLELRIARHQGEYFAKFMNRLI